MQQAIVLTDLVEPILHVCAPRESTLSQLVAIFIRYTDEHPELLHRPYFDLALASLREAFPC